VNEERIKSAETIYKAMNAHFLLQTLQNTKMGWEQNIHLAKCIQVIFRFITTKYIYIHAELGIIH